MVYLLVIETTTIVSKGKVLDTNVVTILNSDRRVEVLNVFGYSVPLWVIQVLIVVVLVYISLGFLYL